jgi:hypothetical protein
MSDDTDLDIVRRAYAKQIMANFGVVDRRVEAAFASVKREHYLGRGPWQVIRWGRGYVPTPSRDPVTSTMMWSLASCQSGNSTTVSHRYMRS